MIREGDWVEMNGWKIWVYGAHKMTHKEKIEEATLIVKSGYLKYDERTARALKERLVK